MELRRLPQSFFQDRTHLVAQKLLGRYLVRRIGSEMMVGKIVETESYTFDDPASHCYQKKTARNQALFGPVGHAYVYKIYGIHYGFNVVAHNSQDIAGGILIRAVEPVQGLAIMETNRSLRGYAVTNGPGKLTQAFMIDTQWYGHNLIESAELFVAELPHQIPPVIKATARIGISKAVDDKSRFIIADNLWVTPHKYNKDKVTG